jgi:CDP-Glycerol:Poly(glycerophosphate) glycerophosphotransferase
MSVQNTSQNKFIFYIAKNYSIPIFIPLAQYLEITGHAYCFYVSDKVKNNFPKEWDCRKILPTIKSAKNFKADFVLCSGNFVDFRIPGIKVQLFHGLGIEKESHFKIRHFFDIYLTSGPYVTQRFEQLQKENPYFLVKETGWPKIDYILNYPKPALDQLNLPAQKKIILYAPTFSTQHESASGIMETIPKIIKKDEFWLFKFHELMDPKSIELYKNIDPSKGKVLLNAEITPYLHAADVMVSDTSSVVYEFMALDKPVVTYRTQGREDKGLNILDVNELRPALDKCLQHPKIFKENRLKHLAEINPVLDGKISANIINYLTSVGQEHRFPKKGKPFNLFRKAQIIYHSWFKKGYLR